MTILVDNVATSDNEQMHSSIRQEKHTLRECMEYVMTDYFNQLDGQEVVDLYEMVISEVEAPLMEAVMNYTRNNQTKASVALGLNRGTLRKKLKKYDML